MSSLPKSVLREMITGDNFKTADDLYSYLKDMFKHALQEMLEAKLKVELGYAKGDKKNKDTDNKTKTMFPSDRALEKKFFLASQNGIKK